MSLPHNLPTAREKLGRAADLFAEPDTRPARLAVAPGSSRPGRGAHGPGPLDGAWWPRSRDLSLELPSLVGTLDLIWGRMTRITVDPEDWPVNPETLPAAGHMVHVGWSAAGHDPGGLSALSYRGGRWDLLVIPPQTPYAMAVRLMAVACDPLNVRSASALLAQADPDRAGMAAWEAEGGPPGMVRTHRVTDTAA